MSIRFDRTTLPEVISPPVKTDSDDSFLKRLKEKVNVVACAFFNLVAWCYQKLSACSQAIDNYEYDCRQAEQTVLGMTETELMQGSGEVEPGEDDGSRWYDPKEGGNLESEEWYDEQF